MCKVVLEAQNISKCIKGVQVLNNVSIALEQGKIYGLVGLSGAGKTTLMSVIAGLVNRDSGRIVLFGESGQKRVEKNRKFMGSVIGSPAVYPEMTAYENINMMRLSRGLPNKELIDQALKAVNLFDDRNTKAHHFSLGMKQRLGIAKALIGEPELLILDEPNSALDMVSNIEIRELLLKLNKEKNVTMLISSKTLEEVDQLATDFIIIHEGIIIETISHQNLHEKCQRYIALKTNAPELTAALFEEKLQTSNYKIMPDNSIKLFDYVDDVNKIVTCLVENEIEIQSININERNLESYFVQSIKGELL